MKYVPNPIDSNTHLVYCQFSELNASSKSCQYSSVKFLIPKVVNNILQQSGVLSDIPAFQIGSLVRAYQKRCNCFQTFSNYA